LIKEPLFRGLDRARDMLAMMAEAVPRLGVDRRRAAEALRGGALATDEVMRRVGQGRAFRLAYRDVATELGASVDLPEPSRRELVSRRRATGNLGNLGLAAVRARSSRARRWGARERRRFDSAITRLAGHRRVGVKRIGAR